MNPPSSAWSSPPAKTDGSWKDKHPASFKSGGMTLRCVFYTPVVILQLPTVVTHLIRYPLLVSFPLLTHFLILLLAFPAISSQLNYLHSNSCSRVGGTPPKTYAYTAELVHQTKSLSHPQTVSEARRTGLNTSEFP